MQVMRRNTGRGEIRRREWIESCYRIELHVRRLKRVRAQGRLNLEWIVRHYALLFWLAFFNYFWLAGTVRPEALIGELRVYQLIGYEPTTRFWHTPPHLVCAYCGSFGNCGKSLQAIQTVAPVAF